MDCLISIPCFRESQRLPSFLGALCQELSSAPFCVSIVVVDDGSGYPENDLTGAIVSDCESKYPAIVAKPVFLNQNRGKGGAVYAGWDEYLEKNNPELLCFVDADGAVPASEVRRLIMELLADKAHHWDALLGSRIKMLGSTVERRAARHYIGRVFATLVALSTGVPVYDSQCGVKVIRKVAYQAIRRSLQEKRFVFDVELILVLLKSGFKVREVPVNWREVAGSKVHVLKDSLKMLTGILRIRQRCGTMPTPANLGAHSGALPAVTFKNLNTFERILLRCLSFFHG